MPLRDRAYYGSMISRLGSLSRGDLLYLVENGLFKASVRVWDAVIEEGEYDRAADGQTFRLPTDAASLFRPARSSPQRCLPWGKLTDDDPAGAPTWGAFMRIDSAEITARAVGQLQCRLTSDDPTYNIQVLELRLVAEVVA